MKQGLRFFLIVLFLQNTLVAQDVSYAPKWTISMDFSFGSENNIGNPGFLYQLCGERSLKKNFSMVSGLGGFHSVPALNKEPNGRKSTFGNLYFYQGIAHSTWFNHNRNFVKIGASLLVANLTYSYLERSFTTYDDNGTPVTTEVIKFENSTRLGYHLGLSGGSRISNLSTLGLCLDIHSYQIFGDILVVGLRFSHTLSPPQ
ncbi:MAG: hypothetical protein KF775_14465 [Cyclobacteriaceae bacterium]|nr:hypothetical protein [Cyclobacteriaceae bacterium]